MIKVCMVVHQYYYSDGRVRRYADALADVGAQVDVLCLRDVNYPYSGQRDGVRIFSIPVSRSRGSRGSYLVEYAKALTLFSARLLKLFARNRYHVVHVHNMPDFLVFAAIIPRIFGAKIILDIHDPMPEFYMSRYRDRMNGAAVRLLQVEETLSSMLAHAVITANPRFKARLVERGMCADKITVINNVADPSVFSRDRYKGERRGDGQHFTLIYPGTIAPRYGLDVAIRALPLLVAKIPQIRLVILGAYAPHIDELAELAQRIGVSSYVQFKPAIPVDEVAQQLVQADIGIYPALPDPYMDLITPVKVLEFAIMGIPIVASRCQVLEELFTDSGIMFFEPRNVDQFARCVLELFNSPGRRDQLVRNADRIFVATHSWAEERRTYFDLLNRLVASREDAIAVD